VAAAVCRLIVGRRGIGLRRHWRTPASAWLTAGGTGGAGCCIHSCNLNQHVRSGRAEEEKEEKEGKDYHVALRLASHHFRRVVGFLDCHRMAVEAAENADRAAVVEIAAAAAAVAVVIEAGAADAADADAAGSGAGADADAGAGAGAAGAGAAGAGAAVVAVVDVVAAVVAVADNVLRVAYC